MAWLKLEDTFVDHPKLRKLARRLGVKPVVARGHMATLWAWVVRHAPDGLLVSYDREDIALAAEWEDEPGTFVGALLEVGLLDETDGGLAIHDWMERAESFKRATQKAKERTGKDSRTTVARLSSDSRDREDRPRGLTDREDLTERTETTDPVPDADAPGSLDASASRSPIAQARAACLDRGWQWTAKARKAFDDLMPFDEDELARALVKTAGQDLSASGGSVYLAGVMRHSRTDALKAEEKSRAGPGKVNGSRLDSLDECKSAGDILASLFPQQGATG